MDRIIVGPPCPDKKEAPAAADPERPLPTGVGTGEEHILTVIAAP